MNFFAFLSRVVGFVLCLLAGIVYVTQAYRQPIAEFAGYVLTVIGALMALSGLSYSKARVLGDDERTPFVRAGERLFHATILLIQSMALKFAVDHIKTWDAIPEWLSWTFLMIAGFTWSFCAIFAFAFTLQGVDQLNDVLWDRRILTSKWD